MQENLSLSQKYRSFWDSVMSIGQNILEIETTKIEELWCVLALCKKSIQTYKTIYQIATYPQIGECITLARTIFDNEIMVRYLLKDSSLERVQNYLAGKEVAKSEMHYKIQHEKSATFQIIRDKIKEDTSYFQYQEKKLPKKQTIREISEQVGLDGSYDTFYWTSSKFIHADLLSLNSYKTDFFDGEQLLQSFFDSKNESMLIYIMEFNPPLLTLHCIEQANNGLKLGLDDMINNCWEFFHLTNHDYTGIVYSKVIPRGEIQIQYTDGSEQNYNSKNSTNRR